MCYANQLTMVSRFSGGENSIFSWRGDKWGEHDIECVFEWQRRKERRKKKSIRFPSSAAVSFSLGERKNSSTQRGERTEREKPPPPPPPPAFRSFGVHHTRVRRPVLGPTDRLQLTGHPLLAPPLERKKARNPRRPGIPPSAPNATLHVALVLVYIPSSVLLTDGRADWEG